MTGNFCKKSEFFRRAEFLSAKDLLQRACAISLVFLLLHAAGLKQLTSVLNGTVGSLTLGWNFSAFLAVIYIVFYLAFVLLVPVLILAALMLLVRQRFLRKSSS